MPQCTSELYTPGLSPSIYHFPLFTTLPSDLGLNAKLKNMHETACLY